jgi:hypothetical protein
MNKGYNKLAAVLWEQDVAGSNPVIPIFEATVAKKALGRDISRKCF